MNKILVLILVIALNTFAADKKSKDEIDHLALAALLLKDGFTSRAKEELKQVNLEKEELDLGRFYTLDGLVQTKLLNYKKANLSFKKALNYEGSDRALWLYIAQNAYKLKDYQGTLDAIAKVRDLANKKPSVIALEAECNWKLKKENAALVTLSKGIKLFPKEWIFYKQRFNYLVSLQLYQAALSDAQIYLKNAKPNEKTVLAFISVLKESGDTDKAIELAEMANLQYVKSAKVTVLLAHLYMDKEMLLAAAELFDEASIEDRIYTKEAAEMMRRSHQFVIALYKNSQMLDMKEKLKQRIAIYIEFGAYERIIVSEKALRRSGLIEDETIRYALAYSYYMTHNFDKSENQLQQLTRPDLFAKATELRKNMRKCVDDGWECEI
jgi:hypothetical protein